MNRADDPGDVLWWAAVLILSVLAVAIAFYNDVASSIATWLIFFIVLLRLRP